METDQRQHRVHRLSGRLLEVLDDVAGASLLGMSADEAGEVAVELTVALSRLTALRLAALAQADRTDIAARVDATSTAGWLRSRLPVTAPAAARDLRLARSLDTECHRPTSEALAAGDVLPDQAVVIVEAVDASPPRSPTQSAARRRSTCSGRRATTTPRPWRSSDGTSWRWWTRSSPTRSWPAASRLRRSSPHGRPRSR